MIPDVIKDRVAELTARPHHGDATELRSGSVALARTLAGDPSQRIVLVAGLNEVDKIAYVHLMTNLVETATDLDLIVTAEQSGYPVPLVAQAELYGPVFIEQLVKTYSALEEVSLDAFCASLYSDGESLKGWEVGLPLRPYGDSRRDFKETELGVLESLVETCRSWLEGAAAPVALIDPGLLLPPARGTSRDIAENQFLDLLDAIREMSALGGSMVDAVELFGGDELYRELSRWWTEFGMDRRALKLDWLLTSDVLSPTPLVSIGGPAEPEADQVRLALIDCCANRGDPTLDLLAARTTVDETPVVRQGTAGSFCRARPRILEAV